MSVIGGMFRYFVVILIIVLGLGVLAAGAMVMFPSFNLFGLHYVSAGYTDKSVLKDDLESEIMAEKTMYTDFINATAVQINTVGYNVTIRTPKTKETALNNNIYVNVSNYVTGFAWSGPQKISTTWGTQIINSENTFVFTVSEPTGWLYHSNAYIELVVDENTFATKDFVVNTANGTVNLGHGDVSGSNGSQLNLKNFTLNGGGGDCNLSYVNISDKIDIKKTSGSVSSSLNVNCPTSIEIWGGLGKISLKEIGTISNNQTLNIKTSNSDMRWDKLYGDLQLTADRGFLKIGTVTRSVNVDCKSCDLQIEKVGTQFNVNGGEGYVRVAEIGDNSTIVVTEGAVTLNKTLGKVNVKTNRGSVLIEEAHKKVSVESVYGSISITWDKSLTYNSAEADDFATVIKVKYSTVNIENIIGTLNMSIIDNGNGKINALYKAINGQTLIQTVAGNITLSLPTSTAYKLVWNSTKNSDIKLGSIQTTKNVGEESFLNASTDENKIQARSISGLIKIRQNGFESM